MGEEGGKEGKEEREGMKAGRRERTEEKERRGEKEKRGEEFTTEEPDFWKMGELPTYTLFLSFFIGKKKNGEREPGQSSIAEWPLDTISTQTKKGSLSFPHSPTREKKNV